MRTLIGLIAAAFVVAGGVFAFQRYYSDPPAPTQAVATPIADTPALKKVKKVKTPVKAIETYADEAKATLKLPPAVIADMEIKVIDATKVASSDHPQTVSTTLNVETGKVETYIKEEPLPWLAFNQRGQARIDTGYKLNRLTGVPQRASRLTVMHDFMQTKALSVGVSASVDTDGSAFAGLGLSYRW